jgi:DeoR/GlpR family transcriptional regulator of sugar metabolism
MLRVERQARELQIIRERGFVQNDELARLFAVTSATIRRDLKALSQHGFVRLDHGGSAALNTLEGFIEPLYESKQYINRAAKQAIGRAAASLVKSGEAVIIDSGTTCMEVARALRQSMLRNLTVITCDLLIAKELSLDNDISTILLGGQVRSRYFSTYGPYAQQILYNLRADRYFMGIDAASLEVGVTNGMIEEVPLKQTCIEVSREVILVADASKFAQNAPHKVCSWNAIHQVITAACPPQDLLDYFEILGITYQVVETPCD